MTISSTTRIAGPFTGNGTASAFPFTFKVFAATDLDVIKLTVSTGTESTLVLTTDYTVTLNGDQNSNPGGTVTLTAGALASGFTLTITSDIANLQPTDLTNQGGFYPEVITDSLDRATIQIQQIADIGDRTLKIPISDGTLNMELPTKTERANSFLSFDANGLPSVVTAGSSGAPATITRQVFSGTGSQTAFTLASDPGALGNSAQVYIGGVYQQRSTYTIAGTTLTFSAAPVAGTNNIEFVNFLTSNIGATSADLVTYTPSGTGAVARSAASKFGDVVSVKDFGAVGDGVADDTAAIQAAMQYQQVSGCVLCFGGMENSYKLSTWSPYTATNPIRITGNGATIDGPGLATKFVIVLADVHISNIRFTSFNSLISNTAGQTSSIDSIVFRDNIITNCRNAVYLQTEFEELLLTQNLFESCEGDVIIIGRNVYAEQDYWKRMVISNNVIRDVTDINFDLRGMLVYGSRATIVANVIDGITGDPSYECHGIYTKCRHTTIADNVIASVGTGTTVSGITIKGSGRADTSSPQGFCSIVTSNVIRCNGLTAVGIRVVSDDVLVSMNIVDNPSQTGIECDGPSLERHSVVGNMVYGTSQPSSVGIRQFVAADTSIVTNNAITGFVTSLRVSGDALSGSAVIASNFMDGPISINPGSGVSISKIDIHNNQILNAGGNGIRFDSGNAASANINANDITAVTPVSWAVSAQPLKLNMSNRFSTQTTDASTKTVISFTLAEASVAKMQTNVVASKSDYTANAAYWKRAVFARQTAGTATQTGTTQSVSADIESAGATTWDSQINLVTNDVRFQLFGQAATTINWVSEVELTIS